MAKKIEGWTDTCKRFVAYMDIMGFKEYVYGHSQSEVNDILTSFYPTVKIIEDFAKKRVTGKLVGSIGKTRPVIFSDSIILVSSDSSKESAFDILSSIGWITIGSIAIGLPIKGAIAYGEHTANFKKSLHFGRPLIYAYELQNELQLYGIVLHHTMEKRLSELHIIENLENEHIFKYPVPMKGGEITHYLVAWNQFYTQIVEELSLLYLGVSGTSRLYVDNTMDFVQWITAKKAELEQKKESSKS